MTADITATHLRQVAAAEMDFDDFNLEDDELDYERSPSPFEQVNSPEADKDTETNAVCDSGSISESPSLTIPPERVRKGIGEPNIEEHSDASKSQTSSLEKDCSQKVLINLGNLFIDDSTETNFNSSSEGGQSNAPPKSSERTAFYPCYPQVKFNPSSLIFQSNSEGRDETRNVAVPESGFDSYSENLKSQSAPYPRMAPIVRFDSSSLFEKLSISGSNDELLSAPGNSLHYDSPDQQTANVISSPNLGCHAVTDDFHPAPTGGLRGILKYKTPISKNEKMVAQCLELLSQTASDDKHLSSEHAMLSSAKKVFKKLCFDQFFQKGECFSSICDDNHNYHKSPIFSHSDDEIWNASLYVICHAALPDRKVVENLIHHYTAKGYTSHALLFAKCIAKVRDADRLELAHFIVNKLSGTIPIRDVVTVILMLNFSSLSSKMQYNQLMEGLGVFEKNSTHYSELMTFLNFRKHEMPARSLRKLIEDSMKYPCDAAWVESISGFVKALHPSQKDEIQPIANEFEELFGLISDEQNQLSEYDDPQAKIPKTEKKRVTFAVVDCEHEVVDCPREVQREDDQLEINFSDEDDAQQDIPNFYGSSDSMAERLSRVFGGSCRTWILNGRCSNVGCSLTHDFKKDALVNLSSKDIDVAADYIISQSQTPSIEIIKIFIELLVESNETARVLSFRKCALKMSTSNGIKLTKLVITLLAKQMGIWEAIEKVLVPDMMDLDNPEDGNFIFDKGLLCFMMMEAIKTKASVLRCVTRALMEHITNLPPDDNAEMVEITSYYIKKFVMTERELPPFPDVLPVKRTTSNSFASHLKVALYKGVPSKYFLAATMLKQAVHDNFRDQAFDVLYTFLLGNFGRARVLTQLLENCKYFDAKTNMLVGELIGTVGLTTSIRLYENENFAETAELLNVLKKFKLNIFTLLPSRENMTEFNLATVYCSVTVDTDNRKDAVDIFLNRCVDSYLNSTPSPCPPDLTKLTSKMFHVFTSALLVEESLALYQGIVARQKSLVSPINIEKFVEPTLRCAFSRPCDAKTRKEALRMYLDVVDSETSITFQKVTHRSVFLIALMEITHASQKFEVKGHVNVIHPLIKKMLLTCIDVGAYFNVQTPQITMHSSMTASEIEVYVMWWFCLYVRARKRQAFDHYDSITVKIVQDCIKDDSRLPIHPSLRNVSASITECTERAASVIKNLVTEPIAFVTGRERGVFELHPTTARALSQTAITIMLQNGYIQAGKDRLCTLCFDTMDLKLADKL